MKGNTMIKPNDVLAYDALYCEMLESIIKFYRSAIMMDEETYGEDYFKKVREVLESRIDFEEKYLRSPYLSR
jgi:hypothetical protein